VQKIILSNVPPEQGKGILFHYNQSFVKVDGWETIDVREIVKDNENIWLDEIHKWHDTLVEKLNGTTPWYPLLPVSRLIVWETINTFSLKPLLFTLAIIQLFDKTEEDICIINPDQNFVDYINEWTQSNSIVFVDDRVPMKHSWLKTHFQPFVFYHLRNLLTLSKLFYLLIFRRKKKINNKQANIIVNSTLLDENLLTENGDHFFGLMVDRMVSTSDNEVIWIYNDLFVKDRKSVNSKLKRMGRNAYFLSDSFHLSDLLFACIHGYHSIHKIKKNIHKICPSIQVGNFKSKNFSYSYIENLALYKAPFVELMVYRQFMRLIKRQNIEFMIYPYEEKTLEHALLMANTATENQVKSIGYAHAGYSKGHLYIRRHNGDLIPRPDQIATTGPEAKSRFILSGVPEDEVISVGTPRYQRRMHDNSWSKNNLRLNILFICGIGFEMVQFADMLIHHRELADENDVIIRRSFHSWKDEQDAAEELLLKNNIPYCSTDNVNLIEEIDCADVVLYESTSAAFQASLRGKLVFKVCLSDIIMTEHFVDSDSINELDQCLDSNQLLNTLDRIKSMTHDEYEKSAKEQRLKFDAIFSHIDKEQFKQLFS